MQATPEPFDTLVRRRVRALRLERDLTLREVAARAHLDASTLSRLESGKRRFALDHIPALARALGVSTDRLLEQGASPDDPIDPRVKAIPQKIGAGLTKWDLAHRGGGATRAYKLLVDPGRDEPPEVLAVHPGNDWMYVLDGTLRLILGDQDLRIEVGEVVEFDPLVPHWFGAVDGPVELLVILGPQGRRRHLHG